MPTKTKPEKPAEPPCTMSVEQAVLDYETHHPDGFTPLELGKHLYQMQAEGLLDETLYSSPQKAWDDHLHARTLFWLKQRDFTVRGLSTRRFIARLDELEEEHRHFVWNSIEEIRDDPARRQHAIEHVEWVVTTQVPAVLERQLRVYRALGMKVDALEQQFREQTDAVFQAVKDANGHEEP